jgi:hypothetical protein
VKLLPVRKVDVAPSRGRILRSLYLLSLKRARLELPVSLRGTCTWGSQPPAGCCSTLPGTLGLHQIIAPLPFC